MSARIKAIHDAATYLFLRQGYSRTQISHIAKAVGVSVGTIYHDFIGKQEIRDFVLKCTIEPAFINQEFQRPITGELFVGLNEEIIAALEKTSKEFAQNLETIAVEYRFEELISDAFDMLAKYAVGCLYIEKNINDCRGLDEYYKDYRKKFFAVMTRYMKAFTEKGIIRPLEHIELTTNLIIETLTWWAMDMRYIAFEPWDVSLELAKEVCLDNIIHAYQLEK